MTNETDDVKDSETNGENAASAEEPTETVEKIEPAEPEEELWPQVRQLLIFQVKLYIDALRDLLMSPLSIAIFVIDVIQKNKGDKALFKSLLDFGRKTEKAINLFNQYDHHDEELTGIDAIISQVEESIRKEYKDGAVSSGAKESLDNSLSNLKERIKRAREDWNKPSK